MKSTRLVLALAFMLLAGVTELSPRFTQAQDDCGEDAWRVNGTCMPADALALDDGWNEIEPGGATGCALDTPFRFWMRPGSDDLLFFLQDGGFCTDAESCDPAHARYTTTVADDTLSAYTSGIFDLANPDNPFDDHTIIFVPSCTGDMFMGDTVTDYGGDITVEHRGFANLMSAITFARDFRHEPPSVTAAGCATGGVGAAIAIPHLSSAFPGRWLTQLGDSSGLAFLTPTDLDAPWNARTSLDSRVSGVPSAAAFTLPEFYAIIAPAVPRLTLAQLDSRQDAVQAALFADPGVDPAAFAEATLSAWLPGFALNVPQFSYALADGDTRCLLTSDAFYTTTIDGIAVSTWVADLAAHAPTGNLPEDQATLNRRLVQAVKDGDLEAMHTLIADGADANASTGDSAKTMLIRAVQNDATDIAAALLAAGANPLIQTNSGYNAFHLAAKNGNTALVELMIPYMGDQIDALSDTQYGPNALHLAASEGHTETVALLLDNGADVQLGDKYGDPALNWATYYGHTEVVVLLIERGADVNAESYAGNSALGTAKQRGHQDIVDILIEAGAE